MTRRTPVFRGFAASLLPLALVACATQANPPPVDQASASAAPATASAAAPPTLPPVPQPPERPVAPESVTDPAIPREQRIANFVDYTASTYGVEPRHIREVLAQAQLRQLFRAVVSDTGDATAPLSGGDVLSLLDLD